MSYYSYGNRIYSINENINTSNDIEVVIDSDIRKLIEVKQLVKSGDLKGAVERALSAGLESVAERIKRFQIEQSRPVRESVAKKDSKTEKGKDIHIIAALKAEIKNCKNPSEKKKLMARLMKYTEKLSNESVAGVKGLK
jgi:hypothetical protein